MYQDLLIAGFGGQGVLLAGKLLAFAGMLEGRQVTWFPSYGAEVRGGTANCTVVVSSREIGSPLVRTPSSMLIMNEASCRKFGTCLKEGGLLVLNTSLVQSFPERGDITRIGIRASDIAEELGDIRTANMVMLGAFIKQSAIVGLPSVISALAHVLPARRHALISLNEQALMRGAQVLPERAAATS